MSRWINADKFKRKMQRIATEAWKMKLTASVESVLNQFIDYINSAPSIDIVHCEECKHRRICFGRLVQGTEIVQLNFCSCGEREDE